MRETFEEWAAQSAFDPSEEGRCELCAQEADLDGGLCETCHDLRLDDIDDADIACGAYWFAADYHPGQFSGLYEALSMSQYKPGPLECGPEGSDGAKMAYEAHAMAHGVEFPG